MLIFFVQFAVLQSLTAAQQSFFFAYCIAEFGQRIFDQLTLLLNFTIRVIFFGETKKSKYDQTASLVILFEEAVFILMSHIWAKLLLGPTDSV